MKSLNFNKAGISLLMLVFAAGCNSNAPVNTTKAPVNEVSTTTLKAAEIKTIDLGAKDGGTVKLNLKFQSKQKFNLKNDFPTDTSTFPLTGFYFELKLYRTTSGTAAPAPKDRFNAPYTTSNNDIGNVYQYHINTPLANQSVVFKGLQYGYDYYISSRVYSPPWYDLTPFNIKADIDLSGTGYSNARYEPDPVNNPGVTAPFSLARFGINPTDIVTSSSGGGNVLTAPGSSDGYTSFSLVPIQPVSFTSLPPAGPRTETLTNLSRNVTGFGDVGGAGGLGMAATNNQPGGGTAPAYTGSAGGHTTEEYVHFNNSVINIMNDDTIGNTSATPEPNFTWDMEVNLMASLTAEVNGNIQLNPGIGAPTGSEMITP